MNCPICGCESITMGERGYGDKSRIDCPRCGPFEISGTAMAMLQSRLSADRLASARLSHAVRHEPRREGEWLVVTSANLDSMVSRPLPDIQHAVANVRAWLAGHMGDDRFCYIPVSNPAHLAAVAGVADGDGVQLLLKHTSDLGEIEITETGIRLTPRGWAAMAPRPVAESSASPVRHESAAADEPVQGDRVEKANCNTCGGARNVFIRAHYDKTGDDGQVSWCDTMEVLECCGCGELSVRRRYWFSEWDSFGHDPITGDEIMIPGIEETCWPPKCFRRKPEWADRLEDDTLRAVLDEIYTALAQNTPILATIGTRTLLDRAIFLAVGDKGAFPAKLDAMVAVGKMGAAEKDTILAITDVGNAAAHRGYCPDPATLDAVLTAAEQVIYREFILPKDADNVKKTTPKKSGS